MKRGDAHHIGHGLPLLLPPPQSAAALFTSGLIAPPPAVAQLCAREGRSELGDWGWLGPLSEEARRVSVDGRRNMPDADWCRVQ